MPGGRPPLERCRCTLTLELELGAADPDDLDQRVDTLVATLTPRLATAIRNHRAGSPRLLSLTATTTATS